MDPRTEKARFAIVPDRPAAGMRLYRCRSAIAEAHYISLSVFYDVFGDKYTKPLYIEKSSRTARLAGRCYERTFLGREFYSLIKDPNGIYRYNATIYQEAHEILHLPFEETPHLGFSLMKASESDIEESYSPRQAFQRAATQNSLLASAVDFVLQELKIPETSLGLIGSLAIDPASKPRDVDLVFGGDAATLTKAYDWVRQGAKPSVPLQRYLPPPLPIVCAFFTAEPPLYPDLSSLRVLQPVTRDFALILKEPVSPPYLNLQVYRAQSLHGEGSTLLVVRDTLSRANLETDTLLHVSGYPASVASEPAILITDVEQQMPTVPFHGGGTTCAYPSGASRP
jgi:hypothetical protein